MLGRMDVATQLLDMYVHTEGVNSPEGKYPPRFSFTSEFGGTVEGRVSPDGFYDLES